MKPEKSKRHAAPRPPSKPKPVIGWREWIALPAFNIKRIKAKIDTGARTSALHAVNIRYIARHGRIFVQFEVHPMQRDGRMIVHCEAPLLEERTVTDSGGRRTLRPVVVTEVGIGGVVHPIEITLITRDSMGFRMLIGRQATRGVYLVDPGRSFVGGKNPIKRSKKTRPTTKSARKKTTTRTAALAKTQATTETP